MPMQLEFQRVIAKLSNRGLLSCIVLRSLRRTAPYAGRLVDSGVSTDTFWLLVDESEPRRLTEKICRLFADGNITPEKLAELDRIRSDADRVGIDIIAEMPVDVSRHIWERKKDSQGEVRLFGLREFYAAVGHGTEAIQRTFRDSAESTPEEVQSRRDESAMEVAECVSRCSNVVGCISEELESAFLSNIRNDIDRAVKVDGTNIGAVSWNDVNVFGGRIGNPKVVGDCLKARLLGGGLKEKGNTWRIDEYEQVLAADVPHLPRKTSSERMTQDVNEMISNQEQIAVANCIVAFLSVMLFLLADLTGSVFITVCAAAVFPLVGVILLEPARQIPLNFFRWAGRLGLHSVRRG
ncbi:MAG: hypothetical protein R3C59_09495 [Planctomycetaceae bacterium]